MDTQKVLHLFSHKIEIEEKQFRSTSNAVSLTYNEVRDVNLRGENLCLFPGDYFVFYLVSVTFNFLTIQSKFLTGQYTLNTLEDNSFLEFIRVFKTYQGDK